MVSDVMIQWNIFAVTGWTFYALGLENFSGIFTLEDLPITVRPSLNDRFNCNHTQLGAVNKGRLHSGGLSSANILRTKGYSSDARRKNFGFFEIYGCLHGGDGP